MTKWTDHKTKRILVQTLLMRNGRNVVAAGHFFFSSFYQWIYFDVIFWLKRKLNNKNKWCAGGGECLDESDLKKIFFLFSPVGLSRSLSIGGITTVSLLECFPSTFQSLWRTWPSMSISVSLMASQRWKNKAPNYQGKSFLYFVFKHKNGPWKVRSDVCVCVCSTTDVPVDPDTKARSVTVIFLPSAVY